MPDLRKVHWLDGEQLCAVHQNWTDDRMEAVTGRWYLGTAGFGLLGPTDSGFNPHPLVKLPADAKKTVEGKQVRLTVNRVRAVTPAGRLIEFDRSGEFPLVLSAGKTEWTVYLLPGEPAEDAVPMTRPDVGVRLTCRADDPDGVAIARLKLERGRLSVVEGFVPPAVTLGAGEGVWGAVGKVTAAAEACHAAAVGVTAAAQHLRLVAGAALATAAAAEAIAVACRIILAEADEDRPARSFVRTARRVLETAATATASLCPPGFQPRLTDIATDAVGDLGGPLDEMVRALNGATGWLETLKLSEPAPRSRQLSVAAATVNRTGLSGMQYARVTLDLDEQLDAVVPVGAALVVQFPNTSDVAEHADVRVHPTDDFADIRDPSRTRPLTTAGDRMGRFDYTTEAVDQSANKIVFYVEERYVKSWKELPMDRVSVRWS